MFSSLGTNAFRMDSWNSSFTMKSCACASITFLAGYSAALLSKEFTTRYKGGQYLGGFAATSSLDYGVQSQDSEGFLVDKVALSSTCQSSFWQSSILVFIHITGATLSRY
jgi:hypothetical protein